MVKDDYKYRQLNEALLESSLLREGGKQDMDLDAQGGDNTRRGGFHSDNEYMDVVRSLFYLGDNKKQEQMEQQYFLKWPRKNFRDLLTQIQLVMN